MLTSLLLIALAHASPPVSVGVSTGAGWPYGVAGVQAEVGLHSPSGAGASVHLAAGVTASAGGHLWLPGKKLHVGLGGSVGAAWEDLSGAESCDGSGTRQPGPSLSTFGADVILDHDIGEPDKLVMRYGAGAAAVVAGCAGGILPLPTVALSYRF